MSQQTSEFSLSEYFAVIGRRRWFILAIGVLVGALAFAYSATQTKKYTATATLIVNDPNQGSYLVGSGGAVLSETPLQLSSAQQPAVTRPAVISAVKTQLGLSQSVSALTNLVTVTIDPDSYALDVAVETTDPHQAAAIANAITAIDSTLTNAAARAGYRQQAAAVAAELHHATNANTKLIDQETLAHLDNLSAVAQQITIGQNATVPTSATSPKPGRNTIAGLLIGLLLAVAAALVWDALDHRLRTVVDVNGSTSEPVIGLIPTAAFQSPSRFRSGDHSSRRSSKQRRSDGARYIAHPDDEAYRILRQNVAFLAPGEGKRTVLITSPMAQEGKSTVAVGLAAAYAQTGARTLLVECDLRRPVLADRLGMQRSPGLTDYLTGAAGPRDILQPTSISPSGPPLTCIAAGSPVPLPAEMLDSAKFHDFLAEVGDVYDAVVLDTAPLLPLADTLGIVPDASVLLLCVRLGRTTRDQLRSTHTTIGRLPSAPPAALVVTGVSDAEGYYGYYRSAGREPAAVNA